MNEEREEGLEGAAREAYRRAARELDPATLGALARARKAALSRPPLPRWAAPAAALAGIAALALAVLATREPAPPAVPVAAADSAEEIEILLAGESLDLLEDLEFYLWLETEPDAG